MAIGKIEITQGVPLPCNPETRGEEIKSIVLNSARDIQWLRPGDYDVTPASWNGAVEYDLSLSVLENGLGLYEILPKTAGASVVLAAPDGSSTLIEGSRQKPIDELDPLTIIAGQHPEIGTPHIYGFILYLAGTRG